MRSSTASGVVRTKRANSQPVYVYAKLNGVTGKTQITTTSMSLQSLALAPADSTIAVGTTQALSLTGIFSDGSTKVDLTASARWQTSNYLAVVINSSGVATGVAPGTATITASWGSLAPVAAELTVSSATVQSITITPATPTIGLGSQQPFTATATFSDGSSQDVTNLAHWTSSAPNVAVVAQHGIASSTGQGEANIVAMFHGVSGSAVLSVN